MRLLNIFSGRSPDDVYNLQRFLKAQNQIYESVKIELELGRKTGHWMWYIFPQIKGLGQSRKAKKYSISSLAEAEDYINHPILGPRLRECTKLVVDIEGRSIREIFGYLDDMKFRSSMTLFRQATVNNGIFKTALRKYFGGKQDQMTLDRL